MVHRCFQQRWSQKIIRTMREDQAKEPHECNKRGTLEYCFDAIFATKSASDSIESTAVDNRVMYSNDRSGVPSTPLRHEATTFSR
jgi:hypothetical protein